MERETGIEPVTSSLGSWRSTAELLPLNFVRLSPRSHPKQSSPSRLGSCPASTPRRLSVARVRASGIRAAHISRGRTHRRSIRQRHRRHLPANQRFRQRLRRHSRSLRTNPLRLHDRPSPIFIRPRSHAHKLAQRRSLKRLGLRLQMKQQRHIRMALHHAAPRRPPSTGKTCASAAVSASSPGRRSIVRPTVISRRAQSVPLKTSSCKLSS